MQPAAPRRPIVIASLVDILNLETVSARVKREVDPFLVDDPCPMNPTGHKPIASCGEVVCWHCAKIFWR